MSFWQDDINADEVLSPRDIMRAAGDELESRTGRLTVSIRESRLEDRIVLAFEVMHHKFLLTVNLFEASHRLDQSYPVVIHPPTPDTPEFLKRQRYVPGQPGAFKALSGMMAIQQTIHGMAGKYVTNEWVCATPSEFKGKLTELFAKDYVKSRIVSILAPTIIEGPSEREDAENTKGDPSRGEHGGDK